MTHAEFAIVHDVWVRRERRQGAKNENRVQPRCAISHMSSNLRPAFISQPFLLRVFPHIMYIHTKCRASGGASVGRTTVAAGYSFSIVCWPAGWRARERTMYTCTQSTYIKWRTDTALARNICVCRGISEPWCFLCDYSSLLSHHSLSRMACACGSFYWTISIVKWGERRWLHLRPANLSRSTLNCAPCRCW